LVFIIRICHDARSRERKIRATLDFHVQVDGIKILTGDFS